MEWITTVLSSVSSFILRPLANIVARKEIEKLEKRIKELEEQLNLRGNLHYENNMYWNKEGGGGDRGPYCSGCYDKDIKLVHLLEQEYGYRCPICKTFIQTRSYPEPVNPYESFFD